MASDSSDSFTTVVSPAELRSARGRGGGPNNVPRRSVRNNRRSDPPRDQQKYAYGRLRHWYPFRGLGTSLI